MHVSSIRFTAFLLLSLFAARLDSIVCSARDHQKAGPSKLPFKAQTAHYEVHTARSRAFSGKLAEQMEIILKQGYQKLFPYTLGRGERFRILIFPDRPTFQSYLRKAHEQKTDRTRFVYMHFRSKRLDKCEVIGFERPEPALMPVLFHEGWHQYFRHRIGYVPQWLNEGLAESFEGCRIDDQARLRFGINRNMLRGLRAIYRLDRDRGVNRNLSRAGQVKIDVLLMGSKEHWRRNSEYSYASSWGLCWFLLRGPNARYRKLLTEAMARLKPDASYEVNTRLMERFIPGRVPLNTLKADFEAYVKNLRPAGAEAHAQGRKALRTGQWEQAATALKKACEQDPHHYLYWLDLGRARMRTGQTKEALACLDKASSLDPENASIHMTRANALMRQKAYRKAIEAADAAIKCDPRFRAAMEKLKAKARRAGK
jgi:tetratricopeptide (TPR) repeat protein